MATPIHPAPLPQTIERERPVPLCTTDAEAEAWAAEWHAAETATSDRAGAMAAAAARVECDLVVLGATAIEDKLQEGVAPTIAALADAGIKLWVLTGDKVETAINIGISAGLLDQDMTQHIIQQDEHADLQRELGEVQKLVE